MNEGEGTGAVERARLLAKKQHAQRGKWPVFSIHIYCAAASHPQQRGKPRRAVIATLTRVASETIQTDWNDPEYREALDESLQGLGWWTFQGMVGDRDEWNQVGARIDAGRRRDRYRFECPLCGMTVEVAAPPARHKVGLALDALADAHESGLSLGGLAAILRR